MAVAYFHIDVPGIGGVTAAAYQPYPVVKEDQVCEGVLTGGRPVDDPATLCSRWRDLRVQIHNRIPG